MGAGFGASRAGGVADGGGAGGAAGNTSVAGVDEFTAGTAASLGKGAGAGTTVATLGGAAGRPSQPNHHIATASNAAPMTSAPTTSQNRLVEPEFSSAADSVAGCA